VRAHAGTCAHMLAPAACFWTHLATLLPGRHLQCDAKALHGGAVWGQIEHAKVASSVWDCFGCAKQRKRFGGWLSRMAQQDGSGTWQG
jgi:hypothetical protein